MMPAGPKTETASAGTGFRLTAVLLILAAGIAVFRPTLDHGFVNWDDPAQILDNPLVRDLSPAGIGGIFTSRVVRQYQPLVTLSFALEYRFFGTNPLPYHLHNLFLHLLNGLLVYALAYRISGRRPVPAFLAGLFFTVHPLQAGAVAWVSGRKDLLSAAFFLLSLLAYQAYLDRGRRIILLASLALGGLALLAKATAAVLPLAMLLLDWRARRPASGRLLLSKIPLFLAAGAISALALGWQAAPEPGIRPLYGWGWGNAALALRTVFFYLRAALFPVRLQPLYPVAPPGGAAAAAGLAGLVILAFSTGLFRGAGGRSRLFGVLLFLLCLAPLSRLFPYAGTEEVALRFMYLPLSGLVLFGALALESAFPAGRARAAAVAAAILVAGLFGVLNRQLSLCWRDGEAFWSAVVHGHPQFDLAHHQLGVARYQRGDYRSAIDHAEKAIELNPDIAYSYVIKGLSHRRLEEEDEAVRALVEARRVLEKMGRTEDAERVSGYLRDLGQPEDE